MTAINGRAESAIAQVDTAQIEQALQASYDPRTSNEVRQQAREYLEQFLTSANASSYGFLLVSSTSLPQQARHFGLSILEAALVRNWSRQSPEDILALKDGIIQLAQGLTPQDPSYIRNKVALLWVNLAKRIWGDGWMDMDVMLQQLWEAQDRDHSSAVYIRLLVLYVLECLSDDICVREDPMAMLRSDVLGQALNEICIPEALFQKYKSVRGSVQGTRHGKEGWLLRICQFLASLAGSQVLDQATTVNAEIKALEAMKPIMSWISLEAIIETDCLGCVFRTLAYGNTEVRLASVELLLSILSRPYNPHFHDSWEKIFRSATSPTRLEMLRRTFESAKTDPEDLDEAKYTLQKKLSEVLATIGDASERFEKLYDDMNHMKAFYDIAIHVFVSDSLLVSIPVLHSLSNAMAARANRISHVLRDIQNVLMDTCLVRLIRFETLPDSTEHPILSYLHDDFETLPELHAFLGNYRRYCLNVVESIALSHPLEVIEYILRQIKESFAGVSALSEASYSKSAIQVAQLEASFIGVKSALSGFSRSVTRLKHERGPGQADDHVTQRIAEVASQLEKLCEGMMSVEQKHPDVTRILARLLVEMIIRLPNPSAQLVSAACATILQARPTSSGHNNEYDEALKLYEVERVNEVTKLAMYFPSQLYERHEEIYPLIEAMLQNAAIDDKTKWSYHAIPMILIQRSSQLDEVAAIGQLRPMLESMVSKWTSPALAQELSSFQAFCKLIGLEDLPAYVEEAQFSKVPEWPKATVDGKGLQIQAHINDRLAELPLRQTTAIISALSEGLKPDSGQKRVAVSLWRDIIPIILPTLLNLLRHATAFYEDGHWAHLPADTQAVIKKMFVDRFWQSGISAESRDDFTARVNASSKSYEGFASSVRGAPRQIRDSCYYIVHSMTRFEEIFYDIPDLSPALSKALLSEAGCLSTHHIQRLISLLERLVERCPPASRKEFIPPLVALAYPMLQAKLTAEWERIEAARTSANEDNTAELSEEMKTDSVVRSTTYAVVNFTARILSLGSPPNTRRLGAGADPQAMHIILISNPSTLYPLLQFMTVALRMRDTRCVASIANTLHSLLPLFTPTPPSASADDADEQISPRQQVGPQHRASDQQLQEHEALLGQVREYMSTATLQAAITSLNEPYFVDIHRDLAALIAGVLHHFSPFTGAPAAVLRSLHGIDTAAVDAAVHRVVVARKEREMRAVVLELLEGIRGVRVSEAGRLGVGGGGAERGRGGGAGSGKSGAQKWASTGGSGGMDVDDSGIKRGGTPPEGGLGGMFGEQ